MTNQRIGIRLAGSLLLVLAGLAQALGLDSLKDQEVANGLKDALSKASTVAVGQLGASNGFWGNDRVRIPLPDSLQKAEQLLRTFGMGQQADDLRQTLNHAAEAAVQEAKPILLNAVKQMTVQDAKGILTGGDTAATAYFRKTSSEALRSKFRPIVSKATKRVQLADKYNTYAGQAAKLGLISEANANLDNYVTEKALDGLFLIISDEEKAIRQDPVGQASQLLKRVFGANW
ncbi:DUF4197 domain-containing protein [Curvibacter sp. CHRR-16]|uniref:DUF4197 domain-containing protein n=1 Tax=Curvibacter sp. CHRR-16 TaxID=2835872 RepID=UPI001BDB68FA|nr:DUF4197 domain-containing protein [Curvibacter sp. CHRR-16]MBT0571227.1 DUF4197 domain-containing protein [Curvibacter sp. CHRR-16]